MARTEEGPSSQRGAENAASEANSFRISILMRRLLTRARYLAQRPVELGRRSTKHSPEIKSEAPACMACAQGLNLA